MKTHIGLLLMLLTPGMFAVAQDSWVQKADFGGGVRTGASGFSLNEKGYVGTGFYDGQWLKDFWEYDPATNVWTQKADFGGVPREGGVGFSIGDKGYLGTGENGDEWPFTFRDLWEYDPLANEWVRKADIPLSRGRYAAIGLAIGNKGYVGFGSYFGEYDPFCWDDLWEFDPVPNAWTSKSRLIGGARRHASGFVVGGKMYVGTGNFFDETSSGTIMLNYKDFWQYDPIANAWTRKADFTPGERTHTCGFALSESGFFSGGYDVASATRKKDVWEYSTVADEWIQRNDFPGTGNYGLLALVINKTAYMGINGPEKDFWQYTPSIAVQDTCATPYALQTIHVADTAVLLGWSLPEDTVNGYRIRCEAVYANDVHKRTVASNTSRVLIHGLLPGTTYKWKMKSFCAAHTAAWIIGPAFTTKRVQSFSANTSNDLHTATNVVSVTPNPCNGNFIVTLHLPQQIQQAEVCLYSAAGIKIWQQKAVPVAGLLTAGINLAGNVVPGVYMLKINHNNGSVKCRVVVE
ncbi:fibronectin type III domain-containing protein [Panacibacter sp. DH6]|uniref:Fibronectin type III domain-containing protein n=1 Tax=Panacibacter microcysteis TaxID=2793269 RepID=A0A931E6S1_9BACT|nr:fibronectin type III domain-containing protein [Panacibacter microcysteis]MBG9374776.1 fibronectin type III domain-containing protein [Panacibacter microcysteis]